MKKRSNSTSHSMNTFVPIQRMQKGVNFQGTGKAIWRCLQRLVRCLNLLQLRHHPGSEDGKGGLRERESVPQGMTHLLLQL